MPISMLYLFEEGSLWEMNYPLVEQTIRPNITGHLKLKYAVTNCIFDRLDIVFYNLLRYQKSKMFIKTMKSI